MVSKIDNNGKFTWSINIGTSSIDSTLHILQGLELSDGRFVLLGIITNEKTGIERPVLIYLQANGNFISSHILKIATISPPIISYYTAHLSQINNKSLGILINIRAYSVDNFFITARIDLATNSTVWCKSFFSSTMYYPLGLWASEEEFIIPGKYLITSLPSGSKAGINLLKLSAIDGSFINSKSYWHADIGNNNSMTFSLSSFLKLNNGQFKVLYDINSAGTERTFSTTFDKDFIIINSKAISVHNSSNAYTSRNYSMLSSGVTAINLVNADNWKKETGYCIIDSSNKIIQQRKIILAPEFVLQNPVGGLLFLSNEGKLNFYLNGLRGKSDIETITTSIYRNDSGCIGPNIDWFLIKDIQLAPSAWELIPGNATTLSSIDVNLLSNAGNVQRELLCRKIYADSISLGADITKCNSDSVILKATSGYSNYNWFPQSNIIAVSDSVIRAFPFVTQDYWISAQTYSGCIMHDTVQIVVNKSAAVNLGSNTSICSGTSLILNAGPGFSYYYWNNELADQYKTVSQQGTYRVKAIDSNNCSSKDTFNLMSLYPKPEINIHQKQILCKGQNDLLKPGENYISYLWQDGSTDKYYLIRYPGKYWVTVKDNNGCFNSDTAIIIKMADPPSNFIFNDTTICRYESITLQADKNFSSYLWNDGSTSAKLPIANEGVYILKVTDENECKGEEKITVQFKNCVNAISFPSAFTPNHDGINDLFKPVIKGNLEQYELSIYNRWGQKIYYSVNPLKGWNGTVSNNLHDNASFVWICKYQFKGEKLKIAKGTLMLIR